MKISLDLDGVLIQIMEEWINVYHRKFPDKKKIDLNVIKQWDFYKDIGVSKEEMIDVFNSIDIMKVPIIDKKAPKYVKKLNNIHDVDIVTARFNGEAERPRVRKKIDAMGFIKGIHYNKLVITDAYPKDAKLGLDYDVYIDDSPQLAKSFQDKRYLEHLKLILMPDQPWNWKIESTLGVVRIKGWKDIMKWLK